VLTLLKSTGFIEPISHVVHLVGQRVCVLSGEALAGGTRRTGVGRALDDDEILILALCAIVMFLAGRDEIVSTGRNNKQWDRDILQVIIRRIVI
jgi:hypothetical protein